MTLTSRGLISFIFLATALVGCGGGGGGGGGQNAVTTTPTTSTTSGSGSSSTSSESTNDEDDSDDSDKTALMLADIANNVIVPAYESLATKTAALSAATGVQSYCSALGGADEASALESVKSLWSEASDAYAKTEVHSVGPADIDGAFRYRVSSYASAPLDKCGLDNSVVKQNDTDFSLANRPANQRGLGAVEYLLFNTELSHSCSPNTAPAGWNDLSESVRKSQRCEYAIELADDIDAAADGIVDNWSEAGSNYIAEFTSEGSAGEKLQELTDAIIIHMDKEAKDKKVGIPTGVKEECTSFSCPDKIERPYVQNSFAAIKANVEGFIDVINGGEGRGFDDLFKDEGYEATATDMLEKAQAAIDNIDAATTTLSAQALAIDDSTKQEACTNAYVSHDETYENYSGCALTGLLKDVTDILKIDFVTIVGVNLPGRVQADND